MEIAPPLLAPLEDGIERYYAIFQGRIQSSANFLRHGLRRGDFVVEVGPPRGRSQPKRDLLSSDLDPLSQYPMLLQAKTTIGKLV